LKMKTFPLTIHGTVRISFVKKTSSEGSLHLCLSNSKFL
jgi:hypothetical protein